MFVINLNNNEQEIPEVQLEEYALKLDAKDFASRSKAKATPQGRNFASPPTRTFPVGKRIWTDVEPGKYSLSDYDISKKLIHLLRHGKQVHREDDGAIEFWRIKDNLQEHFPYCPRWSDDRWKKSMAGGGGNKKRYQYCTDSSGIILYLRALQGHSGRSLIDPTLQDNVVIPSNFFQYIYHVGCAINLHSIINSGLIPGGQNLNNRQTVFFLPVDPMDKNHKDPDTTDLNAPRHAQAHAKSMEETSERSLLGRHQYCSEERIEVLSNTIKHDHSSRNTEKSYTRKCYASPPPPKISLKHDWRTELGSEDAQRPEGLLVQQIKSFQSNQPIPNPDHDRTGQPVVGRDASHEPGNEQSMLNEVNIDFRIPAVPHSVVKQAENSRRRSRTTLTDMLFNKIYNKTKPTTRSVRSQNR